MKKKKKNYKKGGKVPQYFLGGALKKMLAPAAGAAASFIPGIGPAIAPMVASGVGSLTAEEQKMQRQQSRAGSSMGNYANGGSMNFMGQNAFAFAGPSHEGGGVQLPNAEVEGGETMDFVELRNGDVYKTNDGSPYVFSKRLKVPETNTSFADTHKQMVKNNASEDEIKQLALAQEKMTGRDKDQGNSSWGAQGMVQLKGGGKMKYQTGGVPPINPFFVDPFGGASQNPADFARKQIGSNRAVATRNIPAKGLNTITRTSTPRLVAGALGKLGGGAASILATPETLGDSSLSGQGNQTDLRQFLPQEEGIGVLRNDPNNQPYDPLTGQGNPLIFPEIPQGDPRNGAATSYDKQPSAPNVSASAPTDTVMDENVELLDLAQDTRLLNPITTQSVSGETLTNGVPQRQLSRIGPDGNAIPVTESGNQSTQASTEDGVNPNLSSALQFVPDAMNFLTGAFGSDDTPDATRISNRAVEMMDPNVNVEPQLLRNAASYRAILSDPNATPQQKLAAQSAKMQADSAVLADKMNRENQMKSNQASLQANLDAQNAQFANQARTERMQGDAMFGPTGNMARGAMGSAAQKLLMQQAQRNQKRQNDIGAMSVISQLDPALQKRFTKELGILQ